jgi:hypothetical protein
MNLITRKCEKAILPDRLTLQKTQKDRQERQHIQVKKQEHIFLTD